MKIHFICRPLGRLFLFPVLKFFYMKKIATCFFYSLIFILNVKADSPDKKKMNESKVVLQGINNCKGYTFYHVYHWGNPGGILQSDTTLIIPPSGGAPNGFQFWGINRKTGKSTDTIDFNNYYSADVVFIINKIEKDSIYFDNKELSNKNEIVDEVNTDSINNRQLVTEAKQIKKNHYTKIIVLSLAGLIALIALVWLFIRKRKAQKENQV